MMYANTSTTAGPLPVLDTGGDGPVLLFVHGAFVDGRLWRDVVAALADGHRCVVPDLPLGAHRTALRDPDDATAARVARQVVGLMDALDLRDVTLVGNDTGGAICQLVAAERRARLGALVLTSCDAFDHFPPTMMKPLCWAARLPGAATALAQPLRLRAVRKATFAPVAGERLDPALVDDWLRPVCTDPGVRRDAVRLLATTRPAVLRAAVERLRGFDRPALVVWAADDRVFPRRDGQRLAELLGAPFELVAASRSFIPVDQPRRLAELLRAFVAERAAVAA